MLYWPGQESQLAERLAAYARASRLVLFLGAGLGREVGLPGWDELLAELAENVVEDLKGFAELPAVDRARILEARVGSEIMREQIGRRLGGRSTFSLAHVLLASLPVSEAVTTNYDDLFEQAAESVGRPVAVLPYDSVREADRWLLKLHGDAARGDDIVITRDDYLGFPAGRRALAGIVQALLITRHMLFVGFSLRDDNFHQIAYDVRKAAPQRAGDAALGTALFLEQADMLETCGETIWQSKPSAAAAWIRGERFCCSSIAYSLSRRACTDTCETRRSTRSCLPTSAQFAMPSKPPASTHVGQTHPSRHCLKTRWPLSEGVQARRKIRTCPNETLSSMHDARDAEDKRLLEAKEHTQLLENYVYLVQEWVALRVCATGSAAEEVVQRVFLRLASELAAGKSYSRALPRRRLERRELDGARLRVERRRRAATLPEDWDDAAPDEFEAVGGRARPRRSGSPTCPTASARCSTSSTARASRRRRSPSGSG